MKISLQHSSFLDEETSREWRSDLKEKIRQFALAINAKTGYDVLLRLKEHGNCTIFFVDITEEYQSYVFIVTDKTIEYQIYKGF